MRHPDGTKTISAAKLAAALALLPPDALLMPNRVGNIGVLNAAGKYLGFIDLTDETVDLEGWDGPPVITLIPRSPAQTD